ncbi:hypothetical protein F4803DRAFT_563015 [Xylaria telfairii]|nr:hypothetical protein F4803DRAFT_563015 [Xylaria telfairii]
MDPVTALGAAGSVIGIAGFGVQLYQVLSKFVSQVRSAQEQLERVIAEIDSTTSALGEIYSYLEKEARNVETGKQLELFSESSLVKVKGTADKCLVVFWRIETAIAGSEPDGFDDELASRLTHFNRTLASYCIGHTIEIESQLTSDPLRFRDKVRWAFQSSKVERFCKELQRYQSHLGLLLQIVLLGQKQTKQHPTKDDNITIRQIYAFITEIATPEELKSMAMEAQEYGIRRRGRAGGPANSRIHWPSEYPQTQSPTRRNTSKTIQLPGPQRPWDHNDPQAKSNFGSPDIETRHMPMISLPGQAHQNNSSHVNGFTNAQQGKTANYDSGKHSLDHSVQGQITNRASDASLSLAQAYSPVTTGNGNAKDQGGKKSLSATALSERDPNEKPALESPKPGSVVLQNRRVSVQNVTDGSGIGILPYVIQEEGAYRLPMSLQLAREDASSVPREHDLAMELAFLSPGQLQTLQRLLQYSNEAKQRKLVRLEVARKPGRKFWQRRSQVTVAFVEGEISSMPGLLLPQADASSSQANGIAYLRSAQKVDQGRPPLRIGLPEFQDVTNDLWDKMNTPWSQASNGDRFTEYRVWHIEPYSDYDVDGDSVKDWARCLLKEEALTRLEIKRRLRILDKDSATVIEKSTMLTNAQQFQVWRSLEAAKLGDPDLDYQWSLRQLEVIRARRFFIVKHSHTHTHTKTHADNNPGLLSLQYSGKSIDMRNRTAAQRPTSSTRCNSSPSVKSDDFLAKNLKNRKYGGKNDTKVDGGPAAEITNSHDQAIARANNRIANRPPIPSLTRRKTSTTADEHSEPDYESARIRDREREDELERQFRRLELGSKRRRELNEGTELRGRIMRKIEREMESGSGNEADIGKLKPLHAQYPDYHVHEGHERKLGEPEYNTHSLRSRSHIRYAIEGGSPQNRASGHFQHSGPDSFHQLTYDGDPETESPRIRYPRQFDRRRFDPRSVAESQNAVKQLLLEWTPAYMRDDDDGDSTVSAAHDDKNSTSDTGSEEYVMAEEFPIPEPMPVLQQERAKGSRSQSATKVDDGSWSWEVGDEGVQGVLPPVANDVGGHQDALKRDNKEAPRDAVILRGRSTWGGRSGLVSSSPQQLSRPSSKNANDANGADGKSTREVPQTRTSKEPIAQQANGGVRTYQKGKSIARASTLPQISRQPWSNEDWARQVVEETAKAAEHEIGLGRYGDRAGGRRSSFHFPASSSLGPELRAKRRRDGADVPLEYSHLPIEGHLGDDSEEHGSL